MIQQFFNHPINSPVKLGKKAPRIDTRTLMMADYLRPKALPAPPAEVSWIEKVPQPWGMLANDSLGDCVEACQLHLVKQLNFFAGRTFEPTDAQAIQLYSAEGGYVPGDPSTDNGTDMLTALNYWRQTGVFGHKIVAFAQVNWLNETELFQSIQLFGSTFTGISLPISAQSQGAWTVPDGGPFGDGSPGSWGGHCIPLMAASPKSRSFISWGSIMKMSPNFSLDYVDEMYAVITQDWIDANGKSPSGLDLAALMIDLKQVTG